MHFSPISPDQALLNASEDIPNFVFGVINAMLRLGIRFISKSQIVDGVLASNPRLDKKDQHSSWFDFVEAYSQLGWVIQHMPNHPTYGECWVFRVR